MPEKTTDAHSLDIFRKIMDFLEQNPHMALVCTQEKGGMKIEARSRNSVTTMHPLIPEDVIGWTDNDLAAVYEAAVQEAPQTGAAFVEVGAFMGRSSILMARLIEQSNKDIAFVVVDTFQGSAGQEIEKALAAGHGGSTRECFDLNVQRYGVQERINVLQMTSVTAAPHFADGSLSFVFIDAEHTFEAVSADLRAWLPKLRPCGVIAGHDACYPGVIGAVKELLPGHEVRGTCWWYRVPA